MLTDATGVLEPVPRWSSGNFARLSLIWVGADGDSDIASFLARLRGWRQFVNCIGERPLDELPDRRGGASPNTISIAVSTKLACPLCLTTPEETFANHNRRRRTRFLFAVHLGQATSALLAIPGYAYRKALVFPTSSMRYRWLHYVMGR